MRRYGDHIVVIVTGWRVVGPVTDTNVRDDHPGVAGASLGLKHALNTSKNDNKALLSLFGIEEGEKGKARGDLREGVLLTRESSVVWLHG